MHLQEMEKRSMVKIQERHKSRRLLRSSSHFHEQNSKKKTESSIFHEANKGGDVSLQNPARVTQKISENSHEIIERGDKPTQEPAHDILNIPETPQEEENDPVTHWVVTGSWPKKPWGDITPMPQPNPNNKRKRRESHTADRAKRMAENGIFINFDSSSGNSHKDLFKKLLAGDRKPLKYCSYPAEKLLKVISRICNSNEYRIQRDITQWIVPSAEHLFFCDEPNVDNIGDEVRAEWFKCASMGSSRPKPDYVAGLLPQAFTKDEIQVLENYATPDTPFFFTHNLSFPFLICEAKCGAEGLHKADVQNIHSASIAIKAIIDLYKAAFGKTAPERVQDLSEKVLVFTISHNHDVVFIYGHYAVICNDWAEPLEFHRSRVALLSIASPDDHDRFKPYNFVRNVYDIFVPDHLKRIKTAVAFLPKIDKRTTASFAESELQTNQADGSQDEFESSASSSYISTAQNEEVFKMKMQIQQMQQMQQMQQEKNVRHEAMQQKYKVMVDRMQQIQQIQQEIHARAEAVQQEYEATVDRMQQNAARKPR